MDVQPTRPTAKGPSEWFTGDVWVDTITTAGEGSPASVAAVHFMPGARSAWHTHVGGQTLYVTEGRGLVQARGEAIVHLRAGDVHVTADGQEHWHGADGEHLMTHISITHGSLEWGEHVTDEEYRGDR